MLEAKLCAIGCLKSSYCMKKVDVSDFFEVVVHFCFLLKVIEQFTSITEIVCCSSFFKLHLYNYY